MFTSEKEPEFDPPLKSCVFCRSEKIRLHRRDFRGVTIFKCSTCRVQFMNPQYTDQYLNGFYGVYQESDDEHHRYGSSMLPRKLVHHFNLCDIEHYVGKGSFLSVGCGNGLDLEAAKERDWSSVEGHDVDAGSVEKLSRKLKVKVRSGDFARLEYADEQYDCVYLNHVLEHLKNPNQYLEKIYKVMKPKGVLYLACPNLRSLSIAVKTVLEKLKLKRRVGKHYGTWQHLFYYDPFVLKGILEQYYGFRVLSMGNDFKTKPDQTILPELRIGKQPSRYPYKSSFRMLAQKASQEAS
jgi:2-polyprenyl-3-methyl-5-hydroxy-6-metoxy-1,4-benzoquinol methylase